MQQRNKIIVPTGVNDAPAKLPPPYFDEEATLSARRVVPLAQAATAPTPSHPVPSSHITTAGPRRSSRLSLLMLAMAAAIGLGVVGGLAIGLQRGAQKATMSQAPSVAATSKVTTATEQPAIEQPATLPPPNIATTEPIVTAPEIPAQPEDSIAKEDRSKRDKESDGDKSNANKNSESSRNSNKSSDKDKQDESTVVARGRRQSKNDNQSADGRDQSDWRTQRDDDKPKAQRRTSGTENNNQVSESVEDVGRRVRQELNRRIRDVFEGKSSQQSRP